MNVGGRCFCVNLISFLRENNVRDVRGRAVCVVLFPALFPGMHNLSAGGWQASNLLLIYGKDFKGVAGADSLVGAGRPHALAGADGRRDSLRAEYGKRFRVDAGRLFGVGRDPGRV